MSKARLSSKYSTIMKQLKSLQELRDWYQFEILSHSKQVCLMSQ
jgi:hypothetical protein